MFQRERDCIWPGGRGGGSGKLKKEVCKIKLSRKKKNKTEVGAKKLVFKYYSSFMRTNIYETLIMC